MPAPKGNEFWKLRSRHGRKALFDDPKKLWKAACEYFTATDNRKIEVKGYEVTPPYTLEGLARYLHVNRSWLDQFAASLDDTKAKDFSAVIADIYEVIYQQKFEGASVGRYQSMIIARDLSLREATVNEHTGAGGGPIKTGLTEETLQAIRDKVKLI